MNACCQRIDNTKIILSSHWFCSQLGFQIWRTMNKAQHEFHIDIFAFMWMESFQTIKRNEPNQTAQNELQRIKYNQYVVVTRSTFWKIENAKLWLLLLRVRLFALMDDTWKINSLSFRWITLHTCSQTNTYLYIVDANFR